MTKNILQEIHMNNYLLSIIYEKKIVLDMKV